MDLVIVISLEEKETFTPLLRTERSTEVPSCLAQACGHFMEPWDLYWEWGDRYTGYFGGMLMQKQ